MAMDTTVCLPHHWNEPAALQLPAPGRTAWPCVAVVHGQSSGTWPGAPLGSLSCTSTHQTSWVHTMLEDADEQGFISFSIPPVHRDLHVVDVWQQHVQLPAAHKG